MKASDAIDLLSQWDRQERYVYLKRDLRKLFNESESTFDASLNRLVHDGILSRPAHGVYVYTLGARHGDRTLDLIARNLRRGYCTYESLESALSFYGVISQIPLERRTYMTTGRSGQYRTPYGVIDFTHTSMSLSDITPELVNQPDRALPVASQKLALSNLLATRRNTHLIDWQEVNDAEH